MLDKIKPSKPIISINKTDIIIMTAHRSLGMPPYIRINKLKWSFDDTTRIRKRKLMTLALLTGITDCGNIFIGHNGKTMTMKNTTNYGSGRMAEPCMPMSRRHTDTSECSRGRRQIKCI